MPSTSTAKVTDATTTRALARKPTTSKTRSQREEQDGTERLATELTQKLAVIDRVKKGKGRDLRVDRGAKTAEPDATGTMPTPRARVPSSDGKSETLTQNPPTRRLRAPATSSTPEPTDSLVAQFKTKLTLRQQRGSTPPTQIASTHERSLDAMRTVNAASRGLSAALEAGGKSSDAQAAGSKDAKSASNRDETTILEHTVAAIDGLKTLRELKPGDLDIERAAGSLVAKLLSLEQVRVSLIHSWLLELGYFVVRSRSGRPWWYA